MKPPVFTNRQVAFHARLRLKFLENHPEFLEKFLAHMVRSAQMKERHRAETSKDFRVKAKQTAEKMEELKIYMTELSEEHRALLEVQAEQLKSES